MFGMAKMILGAILVGGSVFILVAERGWVKPSTLNFMRQSKDKSSFITAYIYARWTKYYLKIVRTLVPYVVPFRDRTKLADAYHSKVLTHELAKKLITVNENVPLQDLEQVIPYPTARNILLDYPLDIVVMECPCRKSSPHPCSPLMVCMVVGKPFTDFILEHHPTTSKRITQQEALEILEQVHRQGCVHCAYFKEVMLERFYVICNCCKCCCVGVEVMNKHGIPSLTSSGYIAKIDYSKCVSCGACVRACPFDAINNRIVVDENKCMGCGVCAAKCLRRTITMELDPSKGQPLDVQDLKRE